MRVLLAGATGMLGGMIARRLLEQGEGLRILVRPGSDHRVLVDAGAEPVLGDLRDRQSLEVACTGVEAVITTANAGPRSGEEMIEAVDRQGNRNLMNAAKAAGVGRFIYVSAMPARLDYPDSFIRAKAETEKYLRESGIPFTILAPDAYFEGWIAGVVGRPVLNEGPVFIVGEGRRKHSFVSAADVAGFAARALHSEAAVDKRLVIGGPEALTWREVVSTFEDVLGLAIEVRHVRPDVSAPGLGEGMSRVMAEMESKDSSVDMSQMARAYGIRQTRLKDFVRRTYGESG